jgi:phosphohistidine phosphatase SixA
MSETERRRGGHDSVELYLVRHAHAGDPETWRGPDDARPLSSKGERQTARLAAFLARAGVRPAVILSSPKVRATQTAEPLGEALRVQVRVEPLLAAGLDLVDLERILAMSGDPASLMIVGHDPDFSALVNELTGADRLTMPKGAAARIDASRPLVPGAGVLRWLVPPDLLQEV